MGWPKQVLILLMLANWFACIVLCQSEKARLDGNPTRLDQSSFRAASRANSGEDCHICEWVATGGIKASESHVAAPGLVPILIPEFAPAPQRERDLPPKQVHLAEWSIPPPDPVGTFLFVCRTALPVRAPTALA